MAPKNNPNTSETPKQYHVSKAFKSLNTKAHRTAIDQDEFSMLQNVQPVGPGNLRVTPGPLPAQSNASANVVFTSNVETMTSVDLRGNTFISAFLSNGAAQNYDVNNGNVVTIAANGTFSTANVTAASFNQQYEIIGDPARGLFVYDSNVTVQLGAGGAIGMLNVGVNYANVPAVTVSAPDQPGGIQAAAEAILVGNIVSEVVWTQPGTGYEKPPVLTLVGGGGNNAQAVASLLSFRIGQVFYEILNGGQNFTHANVSVTGGGGDGTANAIGIVSNGTIIDIIPQNLGNGYTNTANLVVNISGDGSNAQVAAFVESNLVTDVATYAGRTWVSQGRQLIYSGATNFNDFTGISAGSFYVTDNTLQGNILGMLVANNFLYFYSVDSVNVISDVLVNSNGTTNLTNTNISASIGTNLPFSVFPYYRYVMMMNQYGVYGLIGSTMVKLSDALDGLYPMIDFTKQVTAGQVVINNIVCACFNFYISSYTAPPGVTLTAGYYQAVFFDKKWFLTEQSSLDFVTGSPVGGTLGIYGASGANLYRLYSDTSTNAVSSIVQTALWPMSDPIRDKQVIRFGLEAEIPDGGGIIMVTVDNPTNSTNTYTFQNDIPWVNNLGTIIPWVNSSNNIIPWAGGISGYQLYNSIGDQVGQWGKYVGLTMTSNTANLVYNTFAMEAELRARWR